MLSHQDNKRLLNLLKKAKKEHLPDEYVRVTSEEVEGIKCFDNLHQAVDWVHSHDVNTIVVDEGNHVHDMLEISDTNIIGAGAKENIVIQGILCKGKCLLRNLTITNPTGNGVTGSFDIEDVIVQHCGGSGVWALHNSTCTNVVVRHCLKSGVVAIKNAKITMKGPDTRVHGNCQLHRQYGLLVYQNSKIELVNLKKECVSVDNINDANYGAISGDLSQIYTTDTRPLHLRHSASKRTREEYLKIVHRHRLRGSRISQETQGTNHKSGNE